MSPPSAAPPRSSASPRTPSTPRNAPGCSSSTATACACGIRWSGPRCTRLRPAGSAARRTGPSPKPSTPPTTRTGTRGTAPPPSTAPTRSSSPTWSGPAARAERRGGYAAAAAAYQRAAELTAGEQPRAARLYAAARNAWAAGQTPQARTLVAAARDLADDRLLRADIDRLRGRIEVNVGSATDAHRIFTTAARAVSADDPTRALEMAVAAALLSTYGADSGSTLDTTALAAGATDGDTPRTRCLGHLLLALTHAAAQRWAPGMASLRAALNAGADIGDLDLLSHLGNAALHLGDDEAHHRCFTQMLAGARDGGAGMLVLYALPGSASPRSSAASGPRCAPAPRRRSRSAPAPGSDSSARPRAAGSSCSLPSKVDRPPTTTSASPTSRRRPGSRSESWRTRCTT